MQYLVTFDVPYSDSDVFVQIFLDNVPQLESWVPGDYGQIQQMVYAPAGNHVLKIYAADQLYRDEVITFSEQG